MHHRHTEKDTMSATSIEQDDGDTSAMLLLPSSKPSPSLGSGRTISAKMTSSSSIFDFEFGVWFYCSLLAAAVPVMIPALQFGMVFRLWDQYNKPVNKAHCINSCWDTVFKGTNKHN